MSKEKTLKLLITGANGQLGNCLREIAPTVRHKFVFTDYEELDITNPEAVHTMFNAEKPDWVINCAAYTAVDKAEGDEEMARKLNATAVDYLAKYSAAVGAGLVHISTDYVFKGDNPQPLSENEPTAPVSVYGKTKLEGEKFAELNPAHIIIRTSWLYSQFGKNFVKTMRDLGAAKAEINVVGDQWGSPTSAADLAKAIIVAVEKPKYGTYHFSNEGVTSWALFAEEIMHLSGIECLVNHISTEEYPTAATRPAYSLLDKHKFTTTFGITIPEWESSLEDVIQILEQKNISENL